VLLLRFSHIFCINVLGSQMPKPGENFEKRISTETIGHPNVNNLVGKGGKHGSQILAAKHFSAHLWDSGHAQVQKLKLLEFFQWKTDGRLEEGSRTGDPRGDYPVGGGKSSGADTCCSWRG
jgi:hypothetical protein